MDVKVFPQIFPSEKFDTRNDMRATHISNSDYIKRRLLNKNLIFRLSISYLFFRFEVLEVSNMCHSIAHMLRTVSDKSLSVKKFANRLNNREVEVGNNMLSLMANIRGSREYFAKLSMNIRWTVKQLGPSTLFITLLMCRVVQRALLKLPA